MTTFAKCPECGESPGNIVRVPERLASLFGEVPSAGAVLEQLTCTNGHEWIDWDEIDERDED